MSASGDPQTGDQAAWKRAVAEAAVREIPDGATIGLGSGSTAEELVRALGDRVRGGLRVRGVATSERTQSLAQSLNIPLVALDDVDALDMSFDGADEVTLPALDLVKGRGGALLREKLVALLSRHRVILVDTSKIVSALGAGATIPVEVEQFGWRHTAARLAAPGCAIVRRPASPGNDQPFITDGGHFILDLTHEAAPNIPELAARVKATSGVVEHGLFLGMTERLYIGGADGVRTVDRGQ